MEIELIDYKGFVESNASSKFLTKSDLKLGAFLSKVRVFQTDKNGESCFFQPTWFDNIMHTPSRTKIIAHKKQETNAVSKVFVCATRCENGEVTLKVKELLRQLYFIYSDRLFDCEYIEIKISKSYSYDVFIGEDEIHMRHVHVVLHEVSSKQQTAA